jgi:hypothetical protein
MRFHGNSKQNDKLHHLYAIDDAEENDIFKYGISDKPIDDDGYSARMREQIDYLNRAVGWFRFSADILIRDIEGRAKALDIEDAYITAYKKKNGRNPRGNVE